MKNCLIVDIDTERKDATIIISKPEAMDDSMTKDKFLEVVITDMATLCEGLCTLIHMAHAEGLKKDSDSLRDIIKHLQSGFADAQYTGKRVNDKK